MGDDPSLVTFQIAVALLAVSVSGGLAALYWRQPRLQRALGIRSWRSAPLRYRWPAWSTCCPCSGALPFWRRARASR
jgi:hypothetical protein